MNKASSTIKSYQIRAGDLRASILNLGATLQSLHFKGHPKSLVLGSTDFADYQGELRNAGVIIGPVVNRISNAQFTIGTNKYYVNRNFLDKHCLHSGEVSSANLVWELVENTKAAIILKLSLDDGHMGFPGPIDVLVKYEITEANQLLVEISVTADSAVPCSWTEHNYFNLDVSDSLASHELEVFADHYLPVDYELIPTGEVRSVEDTEFDMRLARSLNRLELDHNFCVALRKTSSIRPVAKLTSSLSGIEMLVESNEPGLQVYTGKHLVSNRNGWRAGVALEPQGWPDSLNNAHFPSIVLDPGENYIHQSRYTFT